MHSRLPRNQTYSTLDPGPYCPLTGQAHTTGSPGLEPSAVVTFRESSSPIGDIVEMGGIAKNGDAAEGGPTHVWLKVG